VECEIHGFGFAAFSGITFHSLIDGIAVGASLIVPSLAPPVFLAIAIHKIPAAFSLCSILLLAGYSRHRTLLHICGFSTATPIGAVLSYFLLRGLSEDVLAIAVGVSAGSFLAIATSDLLPQVHREGVSRSGSLAFLFLGIAVVVGSGFAVGQ
jgi:zinc transporter ZupT